MFSARDQENLTNIHRVNAASKPLNQTSRGLQSKTPFQSRNDENKLVGAGKNLFVTPGPVNRAPLGAKTTNAKANIFKTPAPGQKPFKQDQTLRKASTSRHSVKSKTVVAPSEPLQPVVSKEENEADDDEPDYGYAPPPIIPLADPPLELPYDPSCALFEQEILQKPWRDALCDSPTDENGFSIRFKQEGELQKQEFKRQEEELRKRLEREDQMKFPDVDAEVEAMISRGPKTKPKIQSNSNSSRMGESRVTTLKARSAAAALSEIDKKARESHKLPTAALRETTSSKQKRKPLFTVSRDTNVTDAKPSTLRSAPLPVSKTTIGFPKAKKAPSILPSPARLKPTSDNTAGPSNRQMFIDPLEFVDLYGEPPAESEMWFRLQDRRKQRRKGVESEVNELAQDLGHIELQHDDDHHLDQELRLGMDMDDFELPMPEED